MLRFRYISRMAKPTVGELFAGIGGIGLGFERAGFEVRWANEIDPHAWRVYAKNFPQVELIQEDIRVWEPEERHRVDVLTGGFPCQPVSVAGKQKAQKDERWLWPGFVRVIGHLRPRLVVIENVPGLRHAAEGTAFREVLRDLAALGYDAEWESISASAVGAYHFRERMFCVAYPDSSGLERLYKKNWRKHLQSTQGSLWQEWKTEPNMDRVAYGLPSQVDRLRCLGNAVVPQVAEVVAKAVKSFLAGS